MVKNGLLVLAFLTLALTACGIPISHIDWVDFVQFGGIQYIAVDYTGGGVGRALADADLGPEFAKVEYKHNEPHVFSHKCCRDGDAAFLDAGTPLYMVNGYKPEFRLAAHREGRLVLYEAYTNPKAKTGADLLDIGGKVRYIGVNSAQDGVTELAAIGPAAVRRSFTQETCVHIAFICGKISSVPDKSKTGRLIGAAG